MKLRSLLSSFVLAAAALPAVASDQVVAVAKFRYQLPEGDWREVYFKVAKDTPEAAQAEVLKACNSTRRNVLAGGVLEVRSRCRVGAVVDFEIAQAIADQTLQIAADGQVKPAAAAFQGR